MTNKAIKGRAYEHAVKKLFEEAGYSVIRGAGSKGEMLEEKVDLVATKTTSQTEYTSYLTIIGVQCKVKKLKK